MKKLDLIAYNCGVGAKNTGCGDGARELKKLGLGKKHKANWLPFSKIKKTGKNKINIIKENCEHICKQVQESLNNKHFPVVFGGDHTMAIGTWSGVTKALKAEEKFGLIWLDAHMDSHTTETTYSGAYHGMPLACLMGYGEDVLCSIGGHKGTKIKPENICLIGVRSYEPEEKELLTKLGVRVFYIEEVQTRSIENIIKEAVRIASKNTIGYGISIDIDVFDPEVAPGTGSKEKNGIHLEYIKKFLTKTTMDKKLLALEIAEYNPHLDKNHKTFDLISSIISTLQVK